MKKWANDVANLGRRTGSPARKTRPSARSTGKTRKDDRQTSSEGTHSSYSHQFRVHRANGESVESATIDNILEVYYLWVYQITVCLRLITLLLWHWLGDAELYDSPVTAGTLSHTQRCQPLINWIVLQTTKTMKTRPPALPVSVDFLPIHYLWFCTHKCFHFLIPPFPHFSFPHFLFLLLGQPLGQATWKSVMLTLQSWNTECSNGTEICCTYSDTSGESLALLIVLVVLVDVSEAEKTAEVMRLRR